MAQRAIVHLCKIHTLEAMEVRRQAACVKKLLEAELARLGGGGPDMAGALSKCWVQRALSDSPRHNWVGSTKF